MKNIDTFKYIILTIIAGFAVSASAQTSLSSGAWDTGAVWTGGTSPEKFGADILQ